MSVIKAGTTLTTAYTVEADTTGALEFKTGPSATLAMSISSSGVVTFPATTGFDIASANITNLTATSLSVSAATYLATASGSVGIGTSSPVSKLNIVGALTVVNTAAYNNTSNYNFRFSDPTDTNKTLWGGYDTSIDAGFIQATLVGTAHKNLSLNPNGGNVGIGTTSPTDKLDIAVSSTMGTFGPGTINLKLLNTNTSETNSGSVQFVGYSGNSTSPYQWALISAEKQTSAGDGNYAGKLHFWTTSGGANGEANSGAYRRLTINGNGNVALQGGTQTASGIGITFPATHVASSDANCLDDYEEGTWTPTIVGATNPVYGASIAQGKYTVIGRMVYVEFLIVITSVTSQGTGNIQISGLPFSSASGSYAANISFIYNDTWDVNVRNGYTTGTVIQPVPNSVTQSNLGWAGATLSTGYFSGSGWYIL